MKILIIGSDSYIASHFISGFGNRFSITAVSRVNTGNRSEIVLPDFSNIPDSLFSGQDIVINFAAIVHRPDIKSPSLFDFVNYRLAVENAGKAKASGVKHFIQMSSIAVYGDIDLISEKNIPDPMNPYASSKLKADVELMKMQDNEFSVAIIRPPMVYGGGNSPGNMMRLFKLVGRGIPLPFKGIDNRRDFINVANLIQYIGIICEKRLNGVFLITDHEPVSTEFLLKTIAELLGQKIILFNPSGMLLSLLKRVAVKEYKKLYGSLHIESNFPLEELIVRESVEKGLSEMAGFYKKT